MKFLRINDQEMYKLDVDFNAMCLVEEIEGKGADSILSEKSIGFKVVRTLLYAALNKNYPMLTIAAAGDIAFKMMKKNDLTKLVKIVMSAYQDAGFIGAVEVGENQNPSQVETQDEEDAKKNQV